MGGFRARCGLKAGAVPWFLGVWAVVDSGLYSIVPVDVFADDRLTKTDLRVLLAAFSFRDKASNLFYPGAENIAERVKLPVDKVQTAVDRLVVFGYLGYVK
jgi:hypothetical protein